MHRRPPRRTRPDVRIVTVPDRFWARLWAVLRATVLHPFTTTIIRVIRRR